MSDQAQATWAIKSDRHMNERPVSGTAKSAANGADQAHSRHGLAALSKKSHFQSLPDLPAARQRSEQNFTFSQSRCHFLRQANGRLQTTHILVGKLSFVCTIGT